MRVLVVCHGNINRSALALAVLRRERPDLELRGGALNGVAGRRAAKRARLAAERRGLSLEDHRSTAVDQAAIDWADKIVYMDGGNLRRIEQYQLGLGIAERLVALGPLAGEARIPDPNYVSDPVKQERIFAMVERGAVRLAQELPHG